MSCSFGFHTASSECPRREPGGESDRITERLEAVRVTTKNERTILLTWSPDLPSYSLCCLSTSTSYGELDLLFENHIPAWRFKGTKVDRESCDLFCLVRGRLACRSPIGRDFTNAELPPLLCSCYQPVCMTTSIRIRPRPADWNDECPPCRGRRLPVLQEGWWRDPGSRGPRLEEVNEGSWKCSYRDVNLFGELDTTALRFSRLCCCLIIPESHLLVRRG